MLKTLIIGVALVFLSYSPTPSIAQAPVRGINQYTTQELVEYYAKHYEISKTKILATLKCESGGNEKAWNKLDPGVGSKGIMQFQEGTFYGYASKIGIEKPDIWNTQQQIQVASYMFSKGLAYHWTCYTKLYGR